MLALFPTFCKAAATSRARHSAIPRRDASGLCKTVRPEIRGRRECRAHDAPAASRATKKAHERSHHGHTGNHPAFPAQWFYGLLRALPGDHACLTPSPALLLADLTPTIGASEPHDLAVRVSIIRPARCCSPDAAASTASRPASVTCATPLRGTGRGESVN